MACAHVYVYESLIMFQGFYWNVLGAGLKYSTGCGYEPWRKTLLMKWERVSVEIEHMDKRTFTILTSKHELNERVWS